MLSVQPLDSASGTRLQFGHSGVLQWHVEALCLKLQVVLNVGSKPELAKGEVS